MRCRIFCLFGIAGLAALLAPPAARADWSPFGSYWDNVARAASQNDARAVQQQLSNDRSPNETDENGHSALQIAAINGNLQIAAIMIKAGAKVDFRDSLGNSALFYAAERNQLEMVKLLIEVGAQVDAENKRGTTALMAAAGRGNLEVVQALLSKGANPKKTDFTGRDAASVALEGHRPAVAQVIKRAATTAKQ